MASSTMKDCTDIATNSAAARRHDVRGIFVYRRRFSFIFTGALLSWVLAIRKEKGGKFSGTWLRGMSP